MVRNIALKAINLGSNLTHSRTFIFKYRATWVSGNEQKVPGSIHSSTLGYFSNEEISYDRTDLFISFTFSSLSSLRRREVPAFL